MKHVLLLQPALCVDCKVCELVCSLEHYGKVSPIKSCINVESTPMKFAVPLTCLQCDKPACAIVCVTQALTKNSETGLVDYDADKCIGCKMCVSACPFGNISYDQETQAVIKCDTCNGAPKCVEFCPTGAISWVGEDMTTITRRQAMVGKFEQLFSMEAQL